jgi:hypothetical protein
VDAISHTAPGDIFALDVNQTWSDAVLTKPTLGGQGADLMCCDGRRIYYVQQNKKLLVAATSRPNGAADVEWSMDLSASGENMGPVYNALDTDGRVVALVTTHTASEYSLLLVNAVTGAIIFKANTYPGYDDVTAYSTPAAAGVYAVRGSAADSNIYGCTSAGLSTLLSWSSNPTDITSAPNGVVFGDNATMDTRFLAPIATSALDQPTVPISSIVSDGDQVFGIDTATGKYTSTGVLGGAINITAIAVTITGKPPVDDGYIYDQYHAFRKTSLTLTHTWTLADGLSVLASDGQYLWRASPGSAAINALEIEQGPRYWVRLDGGASGSGVLCDLPFVHSIKGLATPIPRQLIL